jgi:hypothetical protein
MVAAPGRSGLSLTSEPTVESTGAGLGTLGLRLLGFSQRFEKYHHRRRSTLHTPSQIVKIESLGADRDVAAARPRSSRLMASAIAPA